MKPKAAFSALLRVGGWRLFLTGLVGFSPWLSSAEETPAPALVIPLQYRDATNSFVRWKAAFEKVAEPFTVEPKEAGDMIRGRLRVSSQAFACLWNVTATRLRVDVNQNGDLTDDPAGVYAGANSKHFVTFQGIRLPIKTARGIRSLLFNLQFDKAGRPTLTRQQGFLEGKLSTPAGDWQFGLIESAPADLDNPENGTVLLRPWEARDAPLPWTGTADCFRFQRQLFLDGKACQLSCVAGSEADGKVAYHLEMRETPVALGELRLTGQFVERLVLSSRTVRAGASNCAVVLAKPGPVVKVPSGTYDLVKARLAAGGQEARYEQPSSGGIPTPVVINAAAPATLAVGGPLTNTVTLKRQSQVLRLSYKLLGSGGTSYKQAEERSKAPRFAVYAGDKQIGSGTFEFG